MLKSLLSLIAAALLAASAGVHAQAQVSTRAQQASQQGKVRVIVMLRDQAPERELRDNPLRRQQVSRDVDGVLSRLPAGSHVLRRRFTLVPGFAMEVDAAALQRLRDDPAVERIDIDEPGRGHALPDEASDLNRASPLQGMGYGGAGMKVAVIDTGVDTDHPDLASRLIAQQCFCSNTSGTGGCCPNAQATQSGAGAAEDAHGHGTNISGIIVGQGNLAPRGAVPLAQLVAVRVMDANNAFCCTSDVVAAMDWVASNHPDVDAVNLSLGTNAVFSGDCDAASANTQALAAAVNNLVAKGAVVTVSSGNTGSSAQMQAPACVHNATSVGATWDFTGGARTFLGCTETSTAPRQPTCFTNRSTTTDLYAAGAFVTSTGLNGGTSTYGGTSQAAPMVAACATALKQAAPLATPAQRTEAMRLSPTRVTDAVSGQSYPFLDCVDALRLLTGKARSDFNGDGRSDLLWRHATGGSNGIWLSANGATLQPITAVVNVAWKIAGTGDFNGDGKADVLWRSTTTGANTVWLSGNSATVQAVTSIASQAWGTAGIGDFNGDGRADVLWRNGTTGANSLWFSANSATAQVLSAVTDLAWQIAQVGDFDGDGRADIFWRNASTGANAIWRSGLSTQLQAVTTVASASWKAVGNGDFNGDGKADIFWRNSVSGANAIWLSGNSATAYSTAAITDSNWQAAAVGDYNGDGRGDVLWHHAVTGNNAVWYSGSPSTTATLSRVADTNWQIVR